MKRILTVLMSFILLLLLSACQQTPEKATVVEKNSDRLIQEAQKEDGESTDYETNISLSDQYGIPETYQYNTQGADGKLNVYVNALVTVPNESVIPIYRVKAAEFSQDTVDAFFQSLCGDTEMWINSGQRTKAEINDQIVRIRKRIADIQDNPQAADELEIARESLDMLEEMSKTAPDTLEEERTYGKLIEITDPNTGNTYKGLEASEKYDKGLNGKGRYCQIRNDSNPTIWFTDYRNSAAGIKFGSLSSTPVISDTDVSSEILSKIGLKPSDAKLIVQDFLDKTGSHMKVDSIYLQDNVQLGNNGDIIGVGSAEQYAYRIFCIRSVEGLPCSYVAGGSKPDVSDMMAPFWTYEEMFFMVNREGILEMMWHNPIEVIETVDQDAHLKPFSEIQEIFEKMISVKYEPQAELYGGLDFEINRVTLSLHRIIEQDSNESGLLVPAWNFYGKQVLGTSNDQFEKLGESFMTINAIDGSIIDTLKGY